MTLQAPVRYNPNVEELRPDEGKTIADLNGTFDRILTTVANDSGHAVRSVHAKAHGILDGILTVDSDLPPELAQGLFAAPGEHRVYMRLSTNAGDILPDAISLPRGLALKVLDVEGERLPGAEGTTQNFIMVNGKVFQAANAEKFLGSLKTLARTTDRGEGLKVAASTVLRGVQQGSNRRRHREPYARRTRWGAQRRSARRDLLQHHPIPVWRLHRQIFHCARRPGADRPDRTGDRRLGPA